MNNQKQIEITVSLKLQGIDEATEKLERYVQLLKEAKTLADELASIDREKELSSILRGNRHESLDERVRAANELSSLIE